MKKTWNQPIIVKLDVSKTATGGSPQKIEYHDGSSDRHGRKSTSS